MTTDNTNTTRNDSLAARTDTWLQSFLVWSPGQRDIIKTVALVLMVLDHINLIFQLKQEWMFLAGRGAFPLFALVWGLNLSRHAHIRQPAINRLWGWGIIAQFAYYLAGFPWYEGRHCCKVSDEAAFCLIQRPYISKTLLTRRISPRGSP